MISKLDVIKLASLSRLSLSEAEMEKFQGEIDSILGFVAKVKEAAEDAPEASHVSANTLREDRVTHKSHEYTDRLLDSAPNREGEYVKVKKILE